MDLDREFRSATIRVGHVPVGDCVRGEAEAGAIVAGFLDGSRCWRRSIIRADG